MMYHEQQSRQYCAIHAINNLLGECTCTEEEFNLIVKDLTSAANALTSTNTYSYQSLFGMGNYDIEVLFQAVMRRGFSIEYLKTIEEVKEDTSTSILGFICNIPSIQIWGKVWTRHWFGICCPQRRRNTGTLAVEQVCHIYS